MFDANLVGKPLEDLVEFGKEIDWSTPKDDCVLAEDINKIANLSECGSN